MYHIPFFDRMYSCWFAGCSAVGAARSCPLPEMEPPKRLTLKVGAVCALTSNLHVAEGLVTGTRVVVQALGADRIKVRLVNSQRSFDVPRVHFKLPPKPEFRGAVSLSQFPLAVAFAVTTHKSQGMDLDMVMWSCTDKFPAPN